MVPRTPSRTRFVIVAASGILSGTMVASGAPQEEQHGIPRVAGFYMLQGENGGGLRVSFVQKADVLTAIWMQPTGQIFGRGTYRWDPVTGSFKGTSTTRHECLGKEGQQSTSATVLVREELYVVNERELRDRWTKPMAVDCSVGLMKVFKWVDVTWLATDKDWKPLPSRPESPEILDGAR